MAKITVATEKDLGDFAAGKIAWTELAIAGRHELVDSVDFSSCLHLKPYTIACLCALSRLVAADGRRVKAIAPRDEACCKHLARMGIVDFFDCDWASESERVTNLPLREIAWPPTSAADDIMGMLCQNMDFPANVSMRMKDSLDEIIKNALTHGISRANCIVAGQAFPNRHFIEVCVVDLGQGILSHLRGNPQYKNLTSDREAIDLAVVDGVTGTPPGARNCRNEQNSGAGLATMLEYCRTFGGELTILSGSSYATFCRDKPPIYGDVRSPFQGCLVNIRYFTDFS